MSDHIIDTTDDSFEAEVLSGDQPVVVDFWAPWCGPCVAMTPTVESFAAETAGKVKVVKHNTQDHESVASKYGITAIPQILVFHQGKEVHRLVGGGRSVDDLKNAVTESTGVAL